MEAFITELLGGASGVGAYGLVLTVLLLCGLGVPLPEDVVLITGGFLVYKHAARLDVMLVVAFLGILGGDSIAFFLGRHLGDRLTRTWPFRLIVTPGKRAKVEGLFHRYHQKIIVAARFMPGVRAVTYFLAGASRMHYPTFITYDGMAALISAPLFVLLGLHFGSRIDWLVGAVREGQTTAIAVVAAAVATWLLVKAVRRQLKRRRAPAEAGPVAPLAPPTAELVEEAPEPPAHSKPAARESHSAAPALSARSLDGEARIAK